MALEPQEFNQNLQIGFMLQQETGVAGLVFEKFSI
jgi:hypothetical protein